MSKKKQQRHLDYWKNRQEDILRWLDQAELDVSAELAKVYNEQSIALQKDLYAFYAKYAEDNKMTYRDAVQKLRHEDLSDYRVNANRYREQAEKDPELLKRLNEQYASAKATRMDVLSMDLAFRVGMLKGTLSGIFENHLKKVANYAYRKSMGGLIGTINEPALKQLVQTPFNGYNYSQQLWGNTDNLANDLKEVLKKGFVRGDGPAELARELAKKYDVARHRAETLIRTDGTMIVNKATAQRYKDAGLLYYRDLVQMDSRTTVICREIAYKNERKRIDEMKIGVTAPPYHFNCRTTIVPDDDELLGDKDFGDLKEDLTSLWDGISSDELGYEEIKGRLSDRYNLGDLPDYAAISGMPRTIAVTSHDLARTLAKHGAEFPLSQMLLIKDLVEAPDYIADNTQHHNNSVLLYVEVPERKKYLMEGALIPKEDGSFLIHYHKIKKQKLNKLRRERKILYDKDNL